MKRWSSGTPEQAQAPRWGTPPGSGRATAMPSRARSALTFSVMKPEYLKKPRKPKLLTRLTISQQPCGRASAPLHEQDHRVVDGRGAEEEEQVLGVPPAVEDVRRDHQPERSCTGCSGAAAGRPGRRSRRRRGRPRCGRAWWFVLGIGLVTAFDRPEPRCRKRYSSSGLRDPERSTAVAPRSSRHQLPDRGMRPGGAWIRPSSGGSPSPPSGSRQHVVLPAANRPHADPEILQRS